MDPIYIETYYDDRVTVEVLKGTAVITTWNEDDGRTVIALDAQDLWALGRALSVASQSTERRPE